MDLEKFTELRSNTELPPFPSALLSFLENEGGEKTVGIFKNFVFPEEIQEIETLFLSCQTSKKEFAPKNNQLDAAAKALLIWLRKVPLIDFHLYDRCLSATEIIDEDEQVEEMKKIVNQFQKKEIIKRIFNFIIKVAENEEESRMNSKNLSIVLSSSFFHTKSLENNIDQMIRDMQKQTSFFQLLIDNFPSVFV